MGDCVGGVLCFDALCFSNHQRPSSPNNGSRNNSTESLKVGALPCFRDDNATAMAATELQAAAESDAGLGDHSVSRIRVCVTDLLSPVV